MLRVRWLGTVAYAEAHALQRALFARSGDDHLLLLEHRHVYTLGVRADPAHVLVPPASVGADLVRTDRGGDVTYHGPGQLVGYPILSVAREPGATPKYVHAVEDVLIEALAELDVEAGRLDGYPGVWLEPRRRPRKVAAIGVRMSRGRTMHGFALNVAPDLGYFANIVPCGIAEYPVTSLRAEGIDVEMPAVVDAVVRAAVRRFAPDGGWERQDVTDRSVPSPFVRPPAAWAGSSAVEVASRAPDVEAARGADSEPRPTPDDVHGSPDGSVPLSLRRTAARSHLESRLERAGVDVSTSLSLSERKPEWLRARVDLGPAYRELRATMRQLDLVTVCEEAGCPNIYECWAQGTATFMINGDRCTRACGFCLVETARPFPVDVAEPARVAEAVAKLGLAHAVVTAVARDDLDDGGASGFAATIDAIRARNSGTAVEVLVPDCKGDEQALGILFAARPDIFNHNLETVARLQRAVRPSAGYARSLSLLGRAKDAGLVTKSGMILGMGETEPEVLGALADLRGVGVDIVTLGQYLRPSARHAPVQRWWRPEEFAALADAGVAMGFAHVQASPLTRSSYHARAAAAAATGSVPPRSVDGDGLAGATVSVAVR